jgi:hypothetical protein
MTSLEFCRRGNESVELEEFEADSILPPFAKPEKQIE